MISYVFYIYYSFYIIIYFSDNIPSVRLSAWPLQGDIFDGDIAAGPVPTLFSLEPEATVQNIIDNLAKAHSDIQRLAKVFFLMESVLLADCPAILKKPRYNFYLKISIDSQNRGSVKNDNTKISSTSCY